LSSGEKWEIMKSITKLRARLTAACLLTLLILFYAMFTPLALAQETSATEESTSQETSEAAEGLYEDPEGRFTVPVPTNWQVEAREGYTLLTDPDGGIRAYILVTAAGEDIAQAIAEAWQSVDPSFNAPVENTQSPPPSEGIEEIVVVNYDTPQNQVAQAFGQRFEDNLYLLLFEGDTSVVARRGSQLNIIASGFKITALEETNLAAATPKSFDETVRGELETFITENLAKAGIPGAVVAVVQNGEVVYEGAFGVKEKGKEDPLTVDTSMMIGSTGKSLTTMMMGVLVDEGKMTWDTPARQILPSFAVKDPELSKTITMRNLVCACTGVPRRDLELLFNANDLTAEDIVASLSNFEFFTDFGEAFQYSNQMVGTGGYLAAIAGGASPDNLLAGYQEVLEAHVLDPIGMNDTTISFDKVIERGNYATPHGYSISGERAPIALELEQLLTPIAPAGAHWSTAPDMARYMLTELSKGVSPDGERVISEENLLETWQPQVPVSSEVSYGLGWFVGDYKGTQLIEHGGNTLGFTSSFGFLPDKNIGILVLTNAQASNTFNESVRGRFLELVFDLPETVEANLEFALAQEEQGLEDIQKDQVELDVAALEPFVGTYENEALGEVTISLDGGTLRMDAGEFQSELLAYTRDDVTVYAPSEPPLASGAQGGFEFKLEADTPVIELSAPPDVYTFTRK
jgi:CubicO group peptidase (beta-lactamase class C family)